MEMHMVHHKAKFRNLQEAIESKEPTAVAVLGFFFEVRYRHLHIYTYVCMFRGLVREAMLANADKFYPVTFFENSSNIPTS